MPRRPPMSVTVRGTTYPSVAACAAALGVKPDTVYCALSRGNVDHLGHGRGSHKRIVYSHFTRSITICGMKFPSIAALARAINRDPRNLRRSLKSGDLARARIIRRVLKLIADQENAAMRAKLKEQSLVHD